MGSARRPPSSAHPFAPDPAESESARKVLEYAARLLHRRMHEFAGHSVERLKESSAFYGNPLLAPSDVHESAYISLECTIGGFFAPHRISESAEYARQIGRRRTEEGVPLQAMVHAYRRGGGLLWDGLVAELSAARPGHAHLMAYAAGEVWGRVDRDTLLIVEAHRQATAGLPPGDSREAQPLLKALLRGVKDHVQLSALAVELGLPLHGRYAVARLRGPGARRPEGAPHREPRDGFELYWCPHDDGMSVVALLEEATLDDVAAALRPGPGARGGLGTVVTGLAALGRARELADLALSGCSSDGELAVLADRLPGAFVLARPDLARDYAADVLGPVLSADSRERDQLLATLAAWLDCQGSADQVGRRLYCHRNTVLNRLRRLERLTGRRLARPRDMVALALALEAHRTTSGSADESTA